MKCQEQEIIQPRHYSYIADIYLDCLFYLLLFLMWCAYIIILCVFTAEDLEEMFAKKAVIRTPLKNKIQAKSALSLQLEEFESTTVSPLMEYAKFDGRVGR